MGNDHDWQNQDIAVFPAPQALPLVRPPFNYEESVNGTMKPQKNSYFMWIGLPGGKRQKVQLDTGSTGIVIPKTMLTDAEGNLPADVVCLGPAEIKYEPSGDVLVGCYYYVPSVKLGGVQTVVDGEPQMQYAAATGPVVVFGAEYAGTADDPTKNPVDLGEGMMGIGFGRPTLGCLIGATVYQISNPFMSVVTDDGRNYYQSYMLTASDADGSAFVTIGMTSLAFKAAYEGAALVQLTPGTPVEPTPVTNNCNCVVGANPPSPPPAPPCWNSAPVYFSIKYMNGSSFTGTPAGAMLLDTGVDLMMMSTITNPAATSTDNWSEGLGGATITIMAPSEANAVVNYSFKLGKDSGKLYVVQGNTVWPVVTGTGAAVEAPAAFQPVELQANPGSNFVNTGINVIQGYNYLYDGQAGYVGFAPVKAS